MTGARRALLWTSVLAPALALAASAAVRTEEGEVVLAQSGLLLVRTPAAVELLAVRAATSVSGVETVDDLKPGERVRFVRAGARRGAVELASLSVDPVVELSGERMFHHTELAARLDRGDVVVVDVRRAPGPARIAGALRVPGSGADGLRRVLPSDRTATVIFYAEDERSPLALEAATAAVSLGYQGARVLTGGMRTWTESGHAVVIPAAELSVAAQNGDVVVDVRAAARARAGTLPGAISLPLEALTPEPFLGGAPAPALVLVGEDSADRTPFEAARRILEWREGNPALRAAPVFVLGGGWATWRAAGGEPARPAPDARALTTRRRPPGVIDPAEFRQAWTRSERGAALLLDVRKPGEASLHPAALQMPLEGLLDRLPDLPREREVAVFCYRGKRARLAYELLRASGYRVRYLAEAPPPR